jgi:hypothetical protein
MASATLSFEEFAANAASVFERVVKTDEPVVVERGSEKVVIRPLSKRTRNRKREPSEADVQAFLAAAGSWSDVDTDAFLRANYESRDRSVKPAVDL